MQPNISILVLFCLSVMPYGLYWSYDIPGAIQEPITEWFGGPSYYTEAENLLLYSVYSYPNAILPFFAGHFMDKMDVRNGTILACGLILLGQIVFSLGIQLKLFWLCVLGRLFFGFGGETFVVGQGKYVGRWFQVDQMSFFYGLMIGIGRLGTTLNFVLMPIFAEFSVPGSVWGATGICGVCFGVSVFTAFLDIKGEKMGLVTVVPKKEQTFRKLLCSLKEISTLPSTVWLLVFAMSTFYASFITFLATSSLIMVTTGQSTTTQEASLYLAIPNLVGIIIPPIWGSIVDRFGYSLWCCVIGLLLHIGGLAAFSISISGGIGGGGGGGVDVGVGVGVGGGDFVHPAIVMILIGLGYSVFISSCWPLFAVIVEEGMVGRAYGVMTVAENIGYIVVPSVIGAIQTSPRLIGTNWHYLLPIDILLGLAVVSLMTIILVYIIDGMWKNGVLNANGVVKGAYKDWIDKNPTVTEDDDDKEDETVRTPLNL